MVKEVGQRHTVAELGFEPCLLTPKPLLTRNRRHLLTPLVKAPHDSSVWLHHTEECQGRPWSPEMIDLCEKKKKDAGVFDLSRAKNA